MNLCNFTTDVISLLPKHFRMNIYKTSEPRFDNAQIDVSYPRVLAASSCQPSHFQLDCHIEQSKTMRKARSLAKVAVAAH